MILDTDPSVSLFITDLKKIKNEFNYEYILNELKKISAKEDELSIVGLWKRLYVLNKFGIANSLDFIKACADPSISIKRLGYQGVILLNSTKNFILMQNSILKDSGNPRFLPEVLTFIGNLNDEEKIMSEVVERIPKPPEFTTAYLKYLIVKSKYENTLFFSLISDTEIKLFVKLQIVLDNNLESQIDQKDISWLKLKFQSIKCIFTKTKTIQLLKRLYMISKIDVDIGFIQSIRSFLIHPTTKSKRQIEVALALECIQFLIITRNFPERVEEFIFRLINSENPNSRFLGLKYACMHNLMPEIQISKIFEIGAQKKICFDILMKLINKKNAKIVYHKSNQSKIEFNTFKKIIERLCDFADNELILKILLEHPEIYEDMKNKNKIHKEQVGDFFKLVVKKDSPKYFRLIYDLFPVKTKSDLTVAELGTKHFLKLMVSPEYMHLLDPLIDFLCITGSAEMNRKYLLDVVESTKQSIFYRSIEAFNMVLNEKLIFVGETGFIKYQIENISEDSVDLLVKFPEKIDVKVLESNKNSIGFESFITDENGYSMKKFKNISSKNITMEISGSKEVDRKIIRTFIKSMK